ncbi:hypothetical protein [Duganella sp. BuS-21]|uniref:hypothetical protein n=1 Tax=Duganella sp. BuS-21 TaxID=2943848 RepID=UPI0035A71C9C
MTMWPKGLVVAVHYKVNDNVSERLVEAVTNPLEKVLRGIERVEEINTSTTHYSVEAEIRFKDETTQHDLATVTKHIEHVNFGEQVQIISRTAELRPPRLSFDDQEWKAGDSK